MLVELISKKRPSALSKVPRVCGIPPFSFFVPALGFCFACEDLSRFGIPSSLTLSSAPGFRQSILSDFNIYGARFAFCRRKTQVLIKRYQAVRVPTPRIPCSRYAPAWLHLGHYATSAVVHPAQNMVFQHQTELEIAPVQRKLRFFKC